MEGPCRDEITDTLRAHLQARGHVTNKPPFLRAFLCADYLPFHVFAHDWAPSSSPASA